MRAILPDLDRWREQHESIALATLIRVRGSAPQLPGARLCLTRSGRMAGSVSGGCVENDVFERARQVLDSGEPVIATYGIADEVGFAVGLSCGGSIDVLIEPFTAPAAWQAVRRAVEQQRPAVLAIGLGPAALLAKQLAILDDGTQIGSIDASVDEHVSTEARRVLSDTGTRVLTLPWHGEEASVFIETFPPPLRLFIVGATHTAIALCRMAKGFGFRVAVIDARGVYASRERFPDADDLVLAPPAQVLDEARLDTSSHVVILTHDPKFDVPALAQALRSGARYIGVMGSRSTHARRQQQLSEQGFSTADVARIRAPIGLDIGARTPEEIALAILAEMIAVRSGRDGKPLADKAGRIHDRE